jgi:hypothetical protein
MQLPPSAAETFPAVPARNKAETNKAPFTPSTQNLFIASPPLFFLDYIQKHWPTEKRAISYYLKELFLTYNNVFPTELFCRIGGNNL